MSRVPLALRERLVRDVANEVLEKAVLAVLGRPRIRLDRDHLLARERREERLELALGEARDRDERTRHERLPYDRGVLQQAPLLGGQPVEARGDERVERLGYVERDDRARWPVEGAVLDERAAVEEHPHRLDRIQRNALGAG